MSITRDKALEPREIAFEDIKKGDDIEVRYAEDGVTFTRHGITHRPGLRGWYTEAGGLIASDYYGDWKHYLHPRPVPAEPKGLGAVVRARCAGMLTDATDLFVRFGGRPSKGCAWIRVGSGGGFDWPDLDPDSIEVLSEGIEHPPHREGREQ